LPSISPTPYAQPKHTIIKPAVNSKAVAVYDPVTQTLIFGQNQDQELMMASTTKIMTALIALDTYRLDQPVTIYEEDGTIGQTMNLKKGEVISVNNLLFGTLVASGNDAALALALSYPDGGYTGFVKAMNQKAGRLGLTHTQYKNVSGLDEAGHYTSARDLATLAAYALQDPLFAKIVTTKTINVASVDGKIKHQLITTNQLLWKIPDLLGVKTGLTEGAGECLVSSINRNNHQIVTVVLGSSNRFNDTQELINWTYHDFDWKLDTPASLSVKQ
jgi:D-alanyl-D-alanine carboxypeptidase